MAEDECIGVCRLFEIIGAINSMAIEKIANFAAKQ